MKLIIYHSGFIGDVIVCGQNFARALALHFPKAKIDIMIQSKVSYIKDIIDPLQIFNEILIGDYDDYESIECQYDKSFILDSFIYPEGHLRTPFVKANIPFEIFPLTLKISKKQIGVASKIIKNMSISMGSKIIAIQDDMNRKWDEKKVEELKSRLSKIATIIVIGPKVVHNSCSAPLTFLESVALIQKADLFVGIDSGIAHGAALSGTQTILIPPIHPESWISPTEYANLNRKEKKHISIRPDKENFCGHYFCLKGDKRGGTKPPHGDPKKTKCPIFKKKYLFKGESCFMKIGVEVFYKTVIKELY